MPISVKFLLSPLKKGKTYTNPHPIQFRMSIDGHEDSRIGAVWPLDGTGEKIRVDPAKWNVKQQRTTTRDDPANDALLLLKAYILGIFKQQQPIAPPTAKSIRYEMEHGACPLFQRGAWQTSQAPNPNPLPPTPALCEESSLIEAYTTRTIDLRLENGPTPTKTQKINIGRWERGLFLLQEWERQKVRSVPACYRITLTWLRDFHKWLQTQQSDKQSKPISAGMASRYIGKIGMVLQWMVDDELLTHNAVKKTTWPRYDDKEIFFLEPEHITHLFTLRWQKMAAVALWWFLLMCCTGLDLPDAKAYAKNRALLERSGPQGLKLVGRRHKSPHEDYDVPLLDEVDVLFSMYPRGPRQVSGATVNRYTEEIEEELGITWRITNKTARKTFGCLMLINGYYIGEVSRMLGHKRISTTEQHYAKVIGTAVDRGRARVGKTSLL